jgi:small subunit ribosomal protein S16
MLTIRLTRVGKKKDASFRVIVIDSKRKVQAGNYLEMVGSYDPRVDKVDLKADRIKHWLAMGATVSDTVHNLLVSNKIIDEKKKNVLPKKTVPKTEVAAEAAAPAAEPVAETTEEKAEATAPEAQADLPTQADEPKAEDNAVAAEEPAQ